MKIPSLSICLFSLLLPILTHAEDPRANSLVLVFTEVCLPNVGNPDAVYAWAAEKKLSPVTNAAGRKVFVGDGNDGAAWFFQVADITAVLSIRSQTKTCAIYGEKADVEAFRKWFDSIVGTIVSRGAKATTLMDQDQVGEFGHHVGKMILFKGFEKPPAWRVMTLITNERPGGPYQVTMQVGGLQPKP